MLLKLSEWLQRESKLDRPYLGTVVKNDDPKKLKRVKVTVAGLLEGSVDDLPWVYPQSAAFLGGSGNSVTYAIPEMGSQIVIEFPYRNIYAPFYSTTIYDLGDKCAIFEQDYPHSYGFKDSTNNWFRVNKQSGILDFHHHSGTHIQITNTGTINVQGMEDLNVMVARDMNFNAGGNIDMHADGDFSRSAGGNISDTATRIDHN